MTDNHITRESLPVARPVEGDQPDISPALPTPQRALTEIAIVFFCLFFPYIVAVIAEALGAEFPAANLEELGKGIYFKVLLSGSMITLVIWFLLRRDGQTLKSVGLRFTNLVGECKAAFWAVVLIYLVQGLVMLVLALSFPKMAEEIARKRTEVAGIFPEISPWLLVLFTLFVGFYEELLFRGFLITRLNAITKHPWLSVVVSSVIFGAVHFYQDPLAMVQIMIIALVLGGMFVIRGKLMAPILTHMAFDFVSLGLYFTMKKVSPESFQGIFAFFGVG
jgi:membrane protease YdiL (CAAX protease family)